MKNRKLFIKKNKQTARLLQVKDRKTFERLLDNEKGILKSAKLLNIRHFVLNSESQGKWIRKA